jgi:hypothetical protein
MVCIVKAGSALNTECRMSDQPIGKSESDAHGGYRLKSDTLDGSDR